jgi:natural product precursor
MKAKHFDRKLVLKRQTVANLRDEEMKTLYGGATFFTRCGTYCYCPQTIYFTNCAYC